jgi:putative membrane protein
MNRAALLIGAGLLLLGPVACQNKDETKGAATPAEQAATPDAHPAATMPTAPDEAAAPDFVTKAAAGDMFEIASSKLALTRSSSTPIKKFAQDMIDAHTKTTAGLKAAITSAGLALTPPAALPDDLQKKVDDLRTADAKDFDKKYLDDQKDAHQAALDLLQRYAQDGDAPALKAFAAETAPKVQQHLDMVKSLIK